MITALNDTNFPYLRSLRLEFYTPGDIPLHRSPLLRARNLTDLILTDCDLNIAHTIVVWANLTTLKFSRSLWEDWISNENGTVWIYEILQRTTRLVHCDIEVPHEFELPIGEISLPLLETLSMNHGFQYLLPSILLEHINAPALRRFVSRNPDDHPGHLPALFARSQNLKELYLACASPKQLQEDLRTCTSLETLRIFAIAESQSLTEHAPLLQAFTSHSELEPLCPNLISFRCWSPLAISVEVVRKLYGRNEAYDAGHGWKDLTIESMDDDAQEEIGRLSLGIPTLDGIPDVDDPDTW
ncbi:hypothetical protein HYPSUDRAFT_208843 [Hypholoma sublateritium FD-334 SS-4]|uniref:F-box domain-containing protein n=1 Tax=Hypholoma sublateritium (strain FD-334 SS-4) TaxID=945553 RepID=A0A0D2KI72_HYPSF|nr:hypothetical protein HYPSUDRAFT_208843 [Hypholoma sublateritium FD-334 SS-4]